MDILIAGAGPIGGILASFIGLKVERVTIVDPYIAHIEKIREAGLHITGMMEKVCRINEAWTSYKDIFKTRFDVIFIATKATLLPTVLMQLKENKIIGRGEKTFLVSLQNGLDTEEIIAEVVGKERAIRVVLNYGGNLISPGKIEMTFFNPPNYIGSIIPDGEGGMMAREISELLTETGLETEFTDKIKIESWKKAIRNSIMAPICALTGGNIKEMLDIPETRNLMENLLKEAMEVANGLGYDLGKDFFSSCIRYLENAGTHIPSMLVDIKSRRDTEIRFLNYKIVEYGEKLKIITPFNLAISQLIMAIDELKRKGT